MNIEPILEAAKTALRDPSPDLVAICLHAANAMPADASEFDRGLAVGVALARYLADAKPAMEEF